MSTSDEHFHFIIAGPGLKQIEQKPVGRPVEEPSLAEEMGEQGFDNGTSRGDDDSDPIPF